jgi:uncharacterized protein
MNEVLLELYKERYAESPERAFCFAASHTLIKEMKQLLKDGVDINATPSLLGDMVFGGLTTVVEFLIKNGADTNLPAQNGMTPLMRACHFGKAKGEKMAYMLIEAGADVGYAIKGQTTALTCSFENGSRALIKTLIDKGANVNGIHGIEITPLMLAARANNVDAIELLLQHGADPEAKCGLTWAQGLTAEDLAKLEGCKKAYTYLKNYRLSTLK